MVLAMPVAQPRLMHPVVVSALVGKDSYIEMTQSAALVCGTEQFVAVKHVIFSLSLPASTNLNAT
jgi:hypothetical protein